MGVDGHDTLANNPNRYKPAYGIDIGPTSYFNSTVDWIYYNSVKGVQLVGKSENIEMMGGKRTLDLPDDYVLTDHNAVLATFNFSDKPIFLEPKDDSPAGDSGGASTPRICRKRRLGAYAYESNLERLSREIEATYASKRCYNDSVEATAFSCLSMQFLK